VVVVAWNTVHNNSHLPRHRLPALGSGMNN
jgi:hypothetical protein